MPVLDYDIYYDQGSSVGVWVDLDYDITTNYYTTKVALTPDEIYSFKVRARNSVGDSSQSEPISIRAAKPADPPRNLQNVPAITTAYQVGLQW